MADERTQHEDEIFAIKQLFTNMAKPKSSDFGKLIDMADNNPIFEHHNVNGTGERQFHMDLIDMGSFPVEYNEIHLFLHEILGTYVLTNFEQGTYGGTTGIPLTANDFIHLGPHPNVISDKGISEYSAYSSKYIRDNYKNNDELETEFVSKTKPSLIKTLSEINSESGIYSTNIMSNLKYEVSGEGVEAKGVLTYDIGTNLKPNPQELEINPFTKWRKFKVDPSQQAPNIEYDFNYGSSTKNATFKRGDLIILEYDLRNMYDQILNTVIDMGLRYYIVTKDLALTPEAIVLTQGDYVDLTQIGWHELKEVFYEKNEIDNMMSAAANGVAQTEEYLTEMKQGGIYEPGLAATPEGTQFLVEKFTNSENDDPSIENIPADTVDVEWQVQGIFVSTLNSSGNAIWEYSYTFKIPHRHNAEELDGLQGWSQMEKGNVFLSWFDGTDPISLHFPETLKTKYDTASSTAIRVDELVGPKGSETETVMTRLADAESNIGGLATTQLKYLLKGGGVMTGGLSIVSDPALGFGLAVNSSSHFSLPVGVQNSTFGDIVVVGDGGSQSGARLTVNGYSSITERLGVGGDADGTIDLKVYGDSLFTDSIKVNANSGFGMKVDGSGMGLLRNPESGFALSAHGKIKADQNMEIHGDAAAAPLGYYALNTKSGSAVVTSVIRSAVYGGDIHLVRTGSTGIDLGTTFRAYNKQVGIGRDTESGFALSVAGYVNLDSAMYGTEASFSDGVKAGTGSGFGHLKFWRGTGLPATRYNDTIYFLTD